MEPRQDGRQRMCCGFECREEEGDLASDGAALLELGERLLVLGLRARTLVGPRLLQRALLLVSSLLNRTQQNKNASATAPHELSDTRRTQKRPELVWRQGQP
eukprot:1831478-Rhodomonas_salina.1